MREFKKANLILDNLLKSKSPKQAIAIALSEAGQSRKPMMKGGAVIKNSSSRSEFAIKLTLHNSLIQMEH